jgi:hypothetical protein
MTKKAKFIWEFRIVESQNFLQIMLNGGINKVLDIHHESFLNNLNEVLLEIITFDKVIGNKTEVYNLDCVNHAKKLHKGAVIDG